MGIAGIMGSMLSFMQDASVVKQHWESSLKLTRQTSIWSLVGRDLFEHAVIGLVCWAVLLIFAPRGLLRPLILRFVDQCCGG